MKKVLSLIVGVVLGVCVAFPGLRVASAQEELIRLVPEDAVYCDTSVGVQDTWASIVKSNFWKTLTSLRVWDETGARAGIENFAEEFSENMGFDLTTANIMSLFGKEMVFALCVEPGEALKIKGYLLCRSNPKSVAEDIVGKTLAVIKEAAEEAEFTEATYKGAKITSIKPNEAPVEIELGFIGDVFSLGVGNVSPELKEIVDRSKGEGTSLAQNPNFKKVIEASKMTAGRYAGCVYMDMQKIGQIFAALDESSLPMAMQPTIAALRQSFSMPIVMGGNGYIDRGMVMKLVTLPTGEVSNKLIQLNLATPPKSGSTIQYVPENAIAYVAANNTPDWETVWPLLLEQWEKQGAAPAMNMVFSQIEKALGIKMAEDVIPWMGNEFAALFTDIDTTSGFPYPKFALMLKIKDKPKANAFVDKIGAVLQELSDETGFKFEKSSHEGSRLNSVTVMLPMPMPLALTPSFGIVDDFLVVGTSADLLKQMIDTSKGRGKDLATNAAFKAMNIPAETNSVFFGNWGQLMESVKTVAGWVVQFTQAQPGMENVKVVVENHVVPIVNCLSAMKTFGGYQINQENMAAATYILRVEDLPAR